MDALKTCGEERAADCDTILRSLRDRGRVWLRVRGSSMLPWVRPGDIAFVERVKFEDISRGDLVLFAREGRLYVHRAIEKRAGESPQIVTKGDAHPEPDPAADASGALGRVAWIERGGKRVRLDRGVHAAVAPVLAAISRHGKWWYPAGRVAFRLVVPVRRFFLGLRGAKAPAR